MDNTRKDRQKLKKIIQKYTDLLKQPVTCIITQEVPLSNVDSGEKGRNLMRIVTEEAKLKEDRLSWFDDRKNVEAVSSAIELVQMTEVDALYFPFKDIAEVAAVITHVQPSQCSVLPRGNQIWGTMTEICENLIGFDEIWRNEKNPSQSRRMALPSLLNQLENCGLAKNRILIEEDKLGITSSCKWLFQPSYEVRHLLLRNNSSSDHINSSSESLNWNWRIANEFYFKSVASRRDLQQVCNKCKFNLEQVNRSISFVDHLISIQQEQRATAYGFEEKIKSLQDCLWPLGNIVPVNTDDSHISFTPNHRIVLECMWQQKHLLDNACTMLHEVHLLLHTLERNHLKSCSISKDGLEKIRTFIGEFIPLFQCSKDSLDTHLLGKTRDIANAGGFLHPNGVTEEMEKLVNDNFHIIRNFETSVGVLCSEDKYGETIKTAVLGHFRDLFATASVISAKFMSDLKVENHQQNTVGSSGLHGASASTIEADFRVSIKEAYQCILSALNGVLFEKNESTCSDESRRDIVEWSRLFELDVFGSSLDHIVNACLQTTTFAVELLSDPKQSSLVGAHLKHLYALLNAILKLSEGLLCDFLVMHRMVSVTTHVLSDCFASLFKRGFSVEDEVNEPDSGTKGAAGTGLDVGHGLHDISDELEDEDQILGIE